MKKPPEKLLAPRRRPRHANSFAGVPIGVLLPESSRSLGRIRFHRSIREPVRRLGWAKSSIQSMARMQKSARSFSAQGPDACEEEPTLPTARSTAV